MTTATVVGSGPNGLAAAIVLARSGVDVTVLEAADDIGGGTRCAELTVPGVVHDVCSAVHPFGIMSPFFRSLDLERHGLRWAWADIDLAHPIDGGRAGVMTRSLDRTATGLEVDGPAWRNVFGGLAAGIDELVEDLFEPMLHVPRHPLRLARFGVRGLQPASWLVRRWERAETRGLFAGVAAHAFQPLTRPATAAIGMMLIGGGHAVGWPVAVGGSRSISNAMATELDHLGGTIETGTNVRSIGDLPPGVVMLDVSPRAAAELTGDRLPRRVQRAYRRWRHGPAAFKLDLAVEDGIPWTAEECRRAGTVHVGGTFEEITAAESDVAAGRMPARPFVLVGQQFLADPSRSAGNVHPVWTYAHVPHAYDGDATDAILGQLERFAPGVRERIVASRSQGALDLEQYNPNYVGGDISVGANTPWQVVVRPRPALDPYSTGIPGVYLCSAATPPGAGVHGMCGANAARSALRHLAS